MTDDSRASAAIARLGARFPGKRALVTGAASGLGLAFTRALASGGWRLCLLDRNAEALASMNGANVAASSLDVRDREAVRSAVDAFAAAHGGVDVAILCAGVAMAGHFLDGTDEDWQWIFGINVHGVAHGCRAVLPHMIAARSGLIITIASAAGFVSGPQMSAYNASKAAVISLSETLAQELQPHGVQVTVAMPGFFKTALLDQARGQARTLRAARKVMDSSSVDADSVAAEILARAAARRTHVVLPGPYRRLWRFKRFSPALFTRLFPRMRP